MASLFLNAVNLAAMAGWMVLAVVLLRAVLRRLPTIYTTNIQKEDVLRARYTEKTASRLLGSCEVLDFYGTDQRRREK